MVSYSFPQIVGQLEYLEKNVNLLKQAVTYMSKKERKKIKSLFGSLANSKIELSEFKNLRKSLSSSWENKWSS